MNADTEQTVELEYAGTHRRRTRPYKPILLAIGVLAPFILFLYWPFLFGCNRCHSDQQACHYNLRSIAQALITYADGRPDRSFPLDVQALVDANLALPKQFTCPAAVSGQQHYFYVPGLSTGSDPKSVLLIEHPDNHRGRGGHVVTVNGTVHFVEIGEYEAIVDSVANVVR